MNTRGGKVRHFKATNLDDYQQLVSLLASNAMQKAGQQPLEGPISAEIKIFRPMIAMSKKKALLARSGVLLPTQKPDLDNYVKAIFDALNGIAYHDDAQICKIVAEKRYDDGNGERVEIELTQIEGGE